MPSRPRYWSRQVREAVRFTDGIATLQADGVSAFLECGPDGVLSAMGASCVPVGSEARFISSLRKGQADTLAMQSAVAALHVTGCEPEWTTLFEGSSSRVPAQLCLPASALLD